MAHRSPFLTLTLAIFSIALVITLITNPETSFRAAVDGLKIWWEVVFPALLPFIVVSEILMGVGVVHFVGVLLEPIMRPFFNVPGTGGFVLTMGFSSGYPVAAKLTTSLREQGNITRAEGERLVTFTTTGDPLFVIGAVAVGFFHSEQLGYIMAITHYSSAILLGFLYRFYSTQAPSTRQLKKDSNPVIFRALQAMHRARLKDQRAFGKLMGDAVSSALQTLFMVGGFIIVFSVLLQLFAEVKVTDALSHFLAVFLMPFGFPTSFSKALIAGLFEVTLGAQTASEVSGQVSMMWKAAIASSILSWGGLSVHAQVASILSKTDIKVGPYLIGRGIHAFLSAFLTIVLWKPLEHFTQTASAALPAFYAFKPLPAVHSWLYYLSHSVFTAGIIAIVILVLYAASRKIPRRLIK